MTKSDFQKEYGKEWEKTISKPVFVAMLSVADDSSPIRQSPDTRSADIVVGGSILYAEAKGWEGMRRLMTRDLIGVSEDKEIEPDYTERQKI